MQLDQQLLNQFIHPDAANRQHIEKTILQVTDQLLDVLSGAGHRSSLPDFRQLDTPHFKIPEKPQTESCIHASLKELYDLSMNPANPKYIGHMDSIPTQWSVLGDLIA